MTGAVVVHTLHVAVGVIGDARGRVLIARRHPDQHQGGLWEFPGGKVEPGEPVARALARELKEELGITVEAASPLIRIRHDYPQRRVLLDVWRVERFHGEVEGCEGQPVAWVPGERLHAVSFPVANRPIIAAARLPHRYAILDDAHGDRRVLMERLHRILERGIGLLQLRAKRVPPERYARLADTICREAERHGASVLLNSDPAQVVPAQAAGVHLTGRRLMQLRERPLGKELWVAASCHTLEEMRRAESLGLDFVVFSPVMSTTTHPQATPLGWSRFEALVAAVNLPVYALGGLGEADVGRARSAGAQGVAAIRGFLAER